MYTKKLKCARCGATNEINYLENGEEPPPGQSRCVPTCKVCQSTALFDEGSISKAG